jgi:hypothetical protein
MRRWVVILRVFFAEYLNLQPSVAARNTSHDELVSNERLIGQGGVLMRKGSSLHSIYALRHIPSSPLSLVHNVLYSVRATRDGILLQNVHVSGVHHDSSNPLKCLMKSDASTATWYRRVI